MSYFGRADLNIRDRFLVTGTVRADGSSKFGENNKYGVFLHLQQLGTFIRRFHDGGIFDQFKLRASWGLTGNSESPAGAAQDHGFGHLFGFERST
ncbi:MAG: hypothetical protein R2784_12090 [Saprospiraceae bacterium]